MLSLLCCQCKIFGDDFQRANADDPGNYTELGGSDYDIDNNELLCVTGGLLICDTVHPGGASAPQRVVRTFKRTATSEHARVVLAEQDASNYLYASVETVSGCDVLRLFKVVGGTATEVQDAQTIGDGAPLNVWHTLEACLEPANYPTTGDVFRAKLTLASGKVYGTQATDDQDFSGGTQVGIDDVPSVRCNHFRFDWMQDETDPCKAVCPDCKTRQCLIESDAFPGGSETTCKWSSGKLKVFHPELGTKHYILATATISSGQNAEIRLNRNEAGTEYHWVKLALSGTTLTLTIGKTGATLDTKTGTGSAGTFTIGACFDGEFLTGAGGSLSAVQLSTPVADGIYVARAGAATFTYFEFQKHYSADDPSCPNCEEPSVNCTVCCDGLPTLIAADLNAMLTKFSDACVNCPSIGGTYITSYNFGIGCQWAYAEGLCTVETGPGYSACDAFGGVGVPLNLEVQVRLLKNAVTGKCYFELLSQLAGHAGARICYSPSESGSCDCTQPDCTGVGSEPDCTLAGNQPIQTARAVYESDEFDVGECPEWPITLNRTVNGTGFPCNGDWPLTATIYDPTA